MCNLWAHDPSCHPTPLPSHFASLGKLEEHHIPANPIWYRIFFGWKRSLGHSSVNIKLSQSSAISFACFLANLKRALLCFSILGWFSSTIGQNWQTVIRSASWFVFEALSFRPLVHPTYRLVNTFSDFFDWMTRWWLVCSRLSVIGAYRKRDRATCDERGLVEKEGRSGEPVSIVWKTSFRYTSSRYILWLVNFDSLHQCLVRRPKLSHVSMVNVFRASDFEDSKFIKIVESENLLRLWMWKRSEWSKEHV